jgi:hypothetical protein
MTEQSKEKQPPKGLIPTLRDDIARGGWFSSLKREAREIEDFFLSEEERERLKGKGRVRRGFVLVFWLLKRSILHLTSFRRVLLLVGLFLIFADVSYTDRGGHIVMNYHGLGAMLLLFIILLELKDKLLARSELESGRAVQRAMCPEQTPTVPGWHLWLYTRSANEVGGDILDFLRLDGGRFGVAIGDVAGKGLPAALFMVKIQSTLRALAPDMSSLSELATKLNAILIRDGIPGKFASLLYARVDPATGDLQMVNAGHMPPLLVSERGVVELPKGNGALGLSLNTRFEVRELRLNAGECFVVYSDGLTDAQNEAGEFYGLDRFKAFCLDCRSSIPQLFGEKILTAVSSFEGEARRTDDLSLLILQRAS